MKNKIYKILLLFVLVFSLNVVSASEEKSYGLVSSEFENYYEIDTNNLYGQRNRSIYSFYSATPTSFDLRNVNNKRMIPQIDDQGQAPFCWAFASNNVLESYFLMHNLGEINLSDNHPAYVANYFGDGKNGFYSSNSAYNSIKYWFSGYSPVSENKFGKYTIEHISKEYSEYLDNNNLEIDIQDVIVFPMLNRSYVLNTYTMTQVKSIMAQYNQMMKTHIMENGAIFAGIYMHFLDEETNFLYNDGTTTMTDEILNTGHAITIIGWDDSVGSVTIKGTEVKGSWIAMNSWGEGNTDYFYISYYDSNVIQSLFGVDRLKLKEWNNSYLEKEVISDISGQQIYEFKKSEGTEKIESVKLFYRSEDYDISVSISDGYNIYDSITDPSITYGVKSYEFANVTIDTDKIYVIVNAPTNECVNSSDGKCYDVALFTKDEEVEKKIEITDKAFNNAQDTFESFEYDIHTKNILTGTTLTVKVYDDSNIDVTSYFGIEKTMIINDYASLSLTVKTTGVVDYSDYLTIKVSADGITTTVTQYNNGDGTENDPYIIRHAYEMVLLQEENNYFELGNDIDMYEEINSIFGYFYNDNEGWGPFDFTSKLDGKGYSIKNFKTTYGSMFEKMNDGVIKNIKLDNFQVTDENNTSSMPSIIAKKMNNNSIISNVFLNNSSLKSTNNSVGGLVGIMYDGKIENIHIKDSTIESNYYSGIIASKVYEAENEISIMNVYSNNTKVIGSKKGALGVVEVNYTEDNKKPITIKYNIINSEEELDMIAENNISVAGDESIISIEENYIKNNFEIYNKEIFNNYDLENTWSFDNVNSAYLVLFEKDFDNIVKLNTYLLQDNLIYQVNSKTKTSDFITDISNIEDLNYKVYSSSGTELTEEEAVTTGSYIDVSNEFKSKRYYIVVTGDANGDGELSIFDIVKINNHIIDSSKRLEGMYTLAADYNQDGELSIFDIVKINNAIIGGSN